jgi:hypothetical protein
VEAHQQQVIRAKDRFWWVPLLATLLIPANELWVTSEGKALTRYYELHSDSSSVEWVSCNVLLLLLDGSGRIVFPFLCFAPALLTWQPHRRSLLSFLTPFVSLTIIFGHWILYRASSACFGITVHTLIVLIMLGLLAGIYRRRNIHQRSVNSNVTKNLDRRREEEH